MPATRRAVFLERRSYRRRRLADAARLLPVLGLFLIGLPVLWAPAEDRGRDMATTGIYLFVVWLGLIVAAAVLSRTLGGDEPGAAADRAGD